MSYCGNGRHEFLGAVLGSLLVGIAGCIQQAEIPPAEKS